MGTGTATIAAHVWRNGSVSSRRHDRQLTVPANGEVGKAVDEYNCLSAADIIGGEVEVWITCPTGKWNVSRRKMLAHDAAPRFALEESLPLRMSLPGRAPV